MNVKPLRTLPLVLFLVHLTSCVLFEALPEFVEVYCQKDQYVSKNECLACPEGTTNEAGDAAGDIQDTVCDPVVCPEDQYVQGNECRTCPAGTANVAGDKASGQDTTCEPVQCQQNQRVQANACVDCLQGEQNLPGDLASGPDTLCDGTACKRNQRVLSKACVSCPPGTFNDPGDDATDADTQCDVFFCSENQYVKGNQCVPCPPGSVNALGDDASLGDTMCDGIECELNQYVKNNRCVDCGPGTENAKRDDASGSDTFCASVTCPVNHRVFSNRCVPCGAQEIRRSGDDSSGDDTVCEPLTFTDVAVSGDHSCALTSIGGVMCWGSNEWGQIGNKSYKNSNTAVYAESMQEGVVQIALGFSHSCALDEANRLFCWGNNKSGQLGDGTVIDKTTPVQTLKITEKISALRSGSSHMCILTTNGNVYCWGDNSYGQLGNETSEKQEHKKEPTLVAEITEKIISLDTGSSHTCMVSDQGTVYCWGDNFFGELGQNQQTISKSPTPLTLPLSNSQDFIGVYTGGNHTCAKHKDGRLLCWGDNGSGQLGAPESIRSTFVPVDAKASLLTGINLGGRTSCGLLGDRLFCWGAIGFLETAYQPFLLKSFKSGYVKIDTAGNHFNHACMVHKSGTVDCWGENKHGELGNGTTTDQKLPVTVLIK